ncbi:MAG: RluA family pseudouridine synthase [Phycisphaerales bacterium]|nr:RluA family pseudouridine synthase [Phycisphaerales bacterium]
MTDRDEALPERPSLIGPGGKVDPDAVRMAAELGEGDDEGLRRVAFKLTRDLNKRLDKYLVDRIAFMSRNQLQRLIDLGEVTVNGRQPKSSTRLRLGDEVEVVLPPPPAKSIQAEDIPIEVIFEDDVLVVINKSPDIIVHPARSHQRGTLLNALVHHFQQQGGGIESLSTVGEDAARPGVVHRLDRKTSGVMVVAKTDEAHWKLGRQFELRQVDKRYLAVVQGEVPAEADVIELPIGPHPSKAKGMRERMVVRHDDLGKEAVTLYRVRERYRDYTLVELELKTGRTHQIRVHMSYLGFPLVGDDMYEGDITTLPMIVGDTSLASEVVMDRQALHAAMLSFVHPTTGAPMTFTAPMRDDMARLIHLLREHREPSGVREMPGAIVSMDAAMPASH